MQEAIEQFAKQFLYDPVIENVDRLKKCGRFIIAGMGGSNLIGGIIEMKDPSIQLQQHKAYDLPGYPSDVLDNTLTIATSHSGNTEETLSAFDAAVENSRPVIAISTGGQLIERAIKHNVPYIEIPHGGIQPRTALGYIFLATLKAMGREDDIKESQKLAKMLAPHELEEEGLDLAKKLQGFIPVIYASNKNKPLAYIWKITLNETGKIPAFYNVLPELNHNEMNGFDTIDTTEELSENFHFLLLQDNEDHPRIIKRMKILKKQYLDRGFQVETLDISHSDIFFKAFSTVVIGYWTALHTSKLYGTEAEQVPMIEEFKKLMA